MSRTAIQSPSGEGTVKCTHCGSTQVRPSHKRSRDAFQVNYRCLACKRSFKIESPRLRIPTIASVAMVILLLLGLLGLGVGLFVGRSSEAEFQPKVDILDSQVLEKSLARAKLGNPQAEYESGMIYWHRADYPHALPWIKAAASRGHIEAEYMLGMAHLSGRGTVQNYRSAMEHFLKAAEHSHLDAQYQLGLFYLDGLGTNRDKESAYLWLNIAAARGHEDALRHRDRLALTMSTDEINRAQDASARDIARLSGAAAGKP